MKKIKLFTRITVLLLAFLMVFGMVSCGKEEEATVEDTTVATTEAVTEQGDVFNLPDVNYGGADFYILVSTNTEHQSDFAVAVEEVTAKTSVLERAVYNRNKIVQDTYGVKFNFLVAGENTEINEVITNNVGSGSDSHHLVALHGQQTFNHILNQRAVDWNSLKWVNLNNSWWNQSARTAWATPGGRVFAMNGDLSHMSVGNMGGIYYNKTIFRDNNIKTPVEYVKEGAWTYANFKKTIVDLDNAMSGDGSGQLATDTFAYAVQRYRSGNIIRSTGAQFIKKEADGHYSIDVNNDRVINAFNDYLGLFQNGTAFYESRDIATKGGIRDTFKAGRIAVTVDNVKCAQDFAGNGVNFGIVPLYKYDDAVDSYPSIIGSGTNTFMVLINTLPETREMISVIAEALAYYGQKDVLSVYYDTILKYQATQTPDDLAMLEMIHDTAVVDLVSYGNFAGIGEIEWRTIEGVVKGGGEGLYSSITNAIESVSGKALNKLGEQWPNLDPWWDEVSAAG